MSITRSGEKGVALVFTLFLMAALSAMAVSLMFLAQTETSASRNYRTMSQARYAGEAGVHKAISYLLNNYTPPSSMAGYTITSSPVQYNSADVVLSSTAASSNYPDSTVKDAFALAAAGSLAVGTGTVTYAASAKLLSMRNVTIYGGGTGTIQTWQITATGTVPGAMPATVEVTAVLERDIVPAQSYAIFATGAGCGAINLGGNSHTDSYNSTTMSTTPPTTTASGGSVGTNGNLTISGHVAVKGNLDTPRTGVGDCTAGTPTALTAGGTADVTGSVVQLPQAKTYATPDPPAAPYLPTNTAESVSASAASCTLIMGLNAGSNCLFDSTAKTVTVISNGATPLVFNNLSLSAQVNLTVQYGVAGSPATGTATVNVNSLSLGANTTFTIGANTAVTMNVLGNGVTPVVDLSGGTFANSSYDPSKFQITYGGTSQIKLVGGAASAVSVYAPNAAVALTGNADIYGSVLCNTYTNQGDGSVHYDTALSNKYFTLGNYVMSSFSWKKY